MKDHADQWAGILLPIAILIVLIVGLYALGLRPDWVWIVRVIRTGAG